MFENLNYLLDVEIDKNSLYIIKFESARAEIKKNRLLNNKINIRLSGDFKEELLAIIRYEMLIISKNKPFVISKYVKCNCVECEYSSSQFEFDFIRKRELKGKRTLICSNSAEDINISDLLGRHKIEEDTAQIFITQNNQKGMNINNQIIHNSQVNFADNIGKIEYNPHFGITNETFNDFKMQLLTLTSNQVDIIKKEVDIESLVLTNEVKLSRGEKIKNHLITWGISIAQNLSASGIYDLIKLAIIG